MKAVKITREWSITLPSGTIIDLEDNVAAAALKDGSAIAAGGNEHAGQLPAPVPSPKVKPEHPHGGPPGQDPGTKPPSEPPGQADKPQPKK